MSGTSCDGVDAALVEVVGRGEGMAARHLAHVERPFDADFRRELLAVRESGGCSFAELAGIGRTLTLAYAAAVNDLLAGTGRENVVAVAAHGQTLYHSPPDTIQWLDPSLLAAETGLAVVGDFRRADCAAGGQGAPLVPFADWVFFRHPTKSRVILNLGGIANLTYLPAGGGIKDVIAFDTGPGCCVSDWLMRTHRGEPADEGGQLAEAGKAMSSVLARASAAAYFDAEPPKSTDAPAMVEVFEKAVGKRGGRLENLLATAAFCTASTIRGGVARCGDLPPDEVIVAGGGTRNRAIMRALRQLFENTPFPSTVELTDALGLPAQAREAACFAVLGAATLDGEPANVPNATGASRRVVLGSITHKPTSSPSHNS